MANGAGRLTDGQLGWRQGVFSDLPRTKVVRYDTEAARTGATPPLTDGVPQNGLSWAINCSMRGGGIGQRFTMHPVVQGANWSGLYQGGMMYQPDATDPILILAIGGNLYRVRVDTDNSVTDLTAAYGPGIPPAQEFCYFRQAEMFGVIQIGDLITKPLFYDFGVQGLRSESLRVSNGFLGIANPLNEIPPAGPMAFHSQRLWYAFGRKYAAGDIVANTASGTAGLVWQFRDSVIKVTENSVAYGGDAFVVPTMAGNIRGFGTAANLNSTLGEADLNIFTRRSVYAMSAPITREDWTAATLNIMPLQKVALAKGGAYGDRCIVPVNTDLFYSGPPNGDIRSIRTAVRDTDTWGSVPLSNAIDRLLAFNDRSMLYASSGIQFDNRLYMTMMPKATPAGVGFQTIATLDFDTISEFSGREEQEKTPAWEGVQDFSGGPSILQLFEGDFGGRERAFAVVWSDLRSQIEIWELRPDLRFDNGENRVIRVIEFPAYSFGTPWLLKELDSGELWIDKLLGTVNFEVYYRPDSYACWQRWHAFQRCAAKDCREDIDNPCFDDGYPAEPFCEQDAIPISLPRPGTVGCAPLNGRPPTWGFQFQVKLVIQGWCRVRGLLLHAWPRGDRPYAGMVCSKEPFTIGKIGDLQ
jgi:hypothetical protein